MVRPPRVPAERLSPRARAYLATVLMQHLVIGGFALCAPVFFAQPSFDGIKAAMPLVQGDEAMRAWGVVLVAVAAVCAAATWRGSEGQARTALLAACTTEALWLGGYIATAAAAGLTSIVGIVVWSALIARDVTMLRAPLRNPFEPIVRRLLADDAEPPRAAAA